MKKQTAKKKPAEPKKSPRINRFFTEWYVFPIAFSIILVLIAGILGVQYVSLAQEYTVLQKERARAEEEVVFWEKVVEKYPDYRDAYFKIALLEYQLGNTQKSKDYLQKTLGLDPNFDKGRELERFLE